MSLAGRQIHHRVRRHRSVRTGGGSFFRVSSPTLLVTALVADVALIFRAHSRDARCNIGSDGAPAVVELLLAGMKPCVPAADLSRKLTLAPRQTLTFAQTNSNFGGDFTAAGRGYGVHEVG